MKHLILILKILIFLTIPAAFFIRGLDSVSAIIFDLVFYFVLLKFVNASKKKSNEKIILMLTIFTLGNVLGFAYIFESSILAFWDELMHFAFGIILTIVFTYVVYNSLNQNGTKSSVLFILFIGFSFTMLCAVGWEILEYSIDQILYGHPFAQSDATQSPLDDTMDDLILAFEAGLLVLGLGLFKKVRRFLFRKLEES
ncbi:hypothetical protein JW887_01930 [Candidatus Dojkabacteria bacterium]|nr:hypothetical protein [Candidatus Dojkabacteria bacterium]